MRISTAVAVAAMVAGSAIAQTAPTGQAAGTLDPAAGQAPIASAAPAPEFRLADGIVATVNDQIITGFDLRQRMLTVIAMSQVQPTEENIPAIQQQALQALIEERLQAQEIANYETLVVTDEEVDQEIAAMAQDAGVTPDQYMNFLAQGGIRPENMRQQLRTEIGWRQLVGGRFNTRSRVSRAQVEQALRQLSEAAQRPQYLIGEIYIEAARVGGQQAALNGAEQLVAQMIQGAPFQAVARQFSAAPSAARGGDAGWIVQGTVQPALQTALDTLEVGQLSRPIPVEGGVYIIYMRDKRSGSATSLVSLRQAMIELPETASEAEVAAATERLTALRPQLTCDNILQRTTSEAGLLGSDLGESDVANLAPQFQQVARSAEVGTVSNPVRTPLGLHLVAVCGRRVGGADVPTYREVESRLQNQNLAMLARRYIRDLRADALIEVK
ncbi:peptidylprolyl isomerase [Brevundimonas sp. AAP58]|uniref:peptidylprolyl isomerase n=1 Tax=Brevundimonas sp. AAP58 TaxID=1523422 RepID=UPI001E3A85AF|nr:peptidylprolyl isomerase [Brevundimonas sp. AAP58]